MKQQLILTTIGTYQPLILQRLTRSIRDSGATILECRMDLLGNEASITILMSGSWDAIVKLEGILIKLESDLDIKLYSKRTGKRIPEKDKIPYTIEIICGNRHDIINEVTEFLQNNGINICELYTNTYQNPNTDMPLLSIHMTINIPADSSISVIRSEFMDFCDRLNLDAIMEPMKSL
ncbi:MAG: glycine cleavage system transcriptional repressor [Gammaproteobacteria bacterium]|jgi:glycine cleavage system transcriptional repressor